MFWFGNMMSTFIVSSVHCTLCASEMYKIENELIFYACWTFRYASRFQQTKLRMAKFKIENIFHSVEKEEAEKQFAMELSLCANFLRTHKCN